MRKIKKGFSLLELVVAMGVVVVMLGLGITSLTGLRTTVELQGVYSELVENFKSIQNKSKNSISSSSGATNLPFLYGIFFTSAGYSFSDCDKTSSICSTTNSYGNVNTISRNVQITVRDLNNCSGIGFVRLPGINTDSDPVLSIDQLGKYDKNNNNMNLGAKCEYEIKHKQNSIVKVITINLKNGNISLS